MASAGELVIKIAADYATLTQGMAEAGGKVDAFGKKIAAQNQLMMQGVNSLANAFKGLVAVFGIQQVLAYGAALEKTVGDMADMAENLKMTVDEFQAFQGASFLAGQSVEAVATAIGKFNVFIGKASEGSKEQIERLNELGIKILDVNGKLRPQADLLTEVARKIIGTSDAAARAALEVAFFGKSGQAVSAILEQWAKGTEALNLELEAQGLRHLPETIKKMDELADRSAKAGRQMDVFFAPFYAAAKASVMEATIGYLNGIAAALASMSQYEGLMDKIVVFLVGIGAASMGGTPSPALFIQGDIEAADKALTKLRANYDELAKSTSQGAAAGMTGIMREIQAIEMKRLEAIAKMDRLLAPPAVAGPTQNSARGVSNPGVKGAGDSIIEDIKKLEDAALAANSAMARMDSRRGEAWEDVQRNVAQQKEITEKVAELTRKAEAAGRGDLALRIADVARASIEAKNALKQYEQDATAADAATRKLGDGTEEYAKTLRDLNRQQATGRLSSVAYARAVEAATEKMKDQAGEVARFQGGVEAMAAGFEKAARDYVKANDEFAMGARVFNGFINVIDQSLDVLSGTSNKTFESIAGDFAKMLAKMALQAAISPVFKWLMGSVSGLGSGDVPGIPTLSGSDDSGAGGGILSFLGGLFGGGRAIGGGVQPGMSYDVGEHGPERFTPTGAGTITPYKGGGDGGVTVNLDMKQAAGARDPSAALEFGRKVKAAVTDIITAEKRPGGLLYGG